MNPKQKIEELFQTIKESTEYKEYLEIEKEIDKNEEIKKLINMIKRLQQKSVKLEYNKDPKYKEIDKEIEEKVKQLNAIPIYKEYLRRVDELNDILSSSSNQIEKYINSKI